MRASSLCKPLPTIMCVTWKTGRPTTLQLQGHSPALEPELWCNEVLLWTFRYFALFTWCRREGVVMLSSLFSM